MAELQNTIEIEFKGDSTQLINAIKSLDRATKSLVNTQAKLVDKTIKTESIQAKHQKQIASLKIHVKALGGEWKKNTSLLKLQAQALKGDQVAMKKLRIETSKYLVKLKQTNKGMFESVHATRILGGAFSVLRSKMLLAAFAVLLIKNTFGKLITAQGEQELAEKKLSASLGRRSQELLEFASAQQKVTAFGDEETITAMSLVGAYTDNEEAIKRLTVASMDLASAKGMDLKSAVDLVAKSVFSSTNALSRYGLVIEGDIGSTKRLNMATKSLADMYGGQANQQAGVMAKQIERAGNASGDTAEALGRFLEPAIVSMAIKWRGSAEAITLYLDTLRLSNKTLSDIAEPMGKLEVLEARLYLARKKSIINERSGMRDKGKILEKNKEMAKLEEQIAYWIGEQQLQKDNDEKIRSLEKFIQKLQEEEHALKLSMVALGGFNLELKRTEGLSGGIKLVTTSMQDYEATAKETLATQEEENRQIRYLIANNRELAESLGLVQTKEEEIVEASKLVLGAFTGASSAYSSFVQGAVTADINALKQTTAYQNASMEERQIMEEKTQKEHGKALKRSAQLEKAGAIASATINTYEAVTKAYAKVPPPFNLPVAIAIGALGAIQVASIASTPTAYAKGGDFITNKPEMIMVGEAGREHVKITPIDRPESRALKDGGLTINVSAPLVDETILDTIIPAIEKAHRMNLA